MRGECVRSCRAPDNCQKNSLGVHASRAKGCVMQSLWDIVDALLFLCSCVLRPNGVKCDTEWLPVGLGVNLKETFKLHTKFWPSADTLKSVCF